jgi:hypothetical protein
VLEPKREKSLEPAPSSPAPRKAPDLRHDIERLESGF